MTSTAELVAQMSDDEWAELSRRLLVGWFPTHRPAQTPPEGDWLVWLILAGRGWGKTRTGAEWLVDQVTTHGGDWFAAAPTYGDARDVCVEGPSGLLAVLRRRCVPHEWNRSLGELILPNGRIKALSADKPDRVRGWNYRGGWADELAAWRYADTWTQIRLATRIGDRPQVVVTTTPRPVALVTDLIAAAGDGSVVVTRGSTWENTENLSASAIDELRRRYEGTRIGRQELEGEILEDVPGALWTRQLLDDARVEDFPDLVELVVGIDPAVTSGEDADETGIVVVGRAGDGHCYVLEDLSCRATPHEAMAAAVGAYHDLQADRLVIERNNGGDYLPAMVRSIDRTVVVRTVVATRGKALRAQPVSDLYERGMVHHVGALGVLEDQLCGWTPDTPGSPDRMDALVWAVTDLMLVEGGRRGLVVA